MHIGSYIELANRLVSVIDTVGMLVVDVLTLLAVAVWWEGPPSD